MSKSSFQKKPTSYPEQIQQLKSRGLMIQNETIAEFYLKHLSYYRLGAYWLPFESDHHTHQFKLGTRFEDVLNLYVFDRELRLMLIDAIERIEVSVRAQWAYELSLAHGPHAYMEDCLARDLTQWAANLEKLRDEVNRSREVFIQHFKDQYIEDLPPIWAVAEVMSLGALSKWYQSLGPKKLRSAIAKTYQIDEGVLQSWLHHLVIIRNICAHHSRIWNRDITFTIKIPKHKPFSLVSEFLPKSRKLYNTLVLLLHCLDIIAPEHQWRARLINLIRQHEIQVKMMGFPADWEERDIWCRQPF